MTPLPPDWSRHRRWETLAELDRLRDELTAWGAHRRDPDPESGGGDAGAQYEQQLVAVETEVGEAIEAVRQSVPDVPTDAGQRAVALGKIDRQIIWLRQAWSFFRSKFDQRDDGTLRPALLAADEVIWSCYKPFFGQASQVPVPAPLPCIEFDYAPTSVQRDHGHVLPRSSESAGLLDDYFETLPIALLRLPPSVVSSPWTLALVAHEIGHAVLPTVAADGTYGATLQGIVANVAKDGDGVAAWSGSAWVTELFADWYSVAMLGPWAIWALANAEFADAPRMRARRTSYPSPLARLAFVTRLSEKMAVRSTWSPLEEFDVSSATLDAATGDLRNDIAIARALAERFVRLQLPNGKTLAATVDFRAGDFDDPPKRGPGVELSDTGHWARALGESANRANQPSTRGARLVVAGAARARADASRLDGAAAQARIALVRDHTFERIVANADRQTRTAAPVAPRPGRVPLKTRLLSAPESLLFAR